MKTFSKSHVVTLHKQRIFLFIVFSSCSEFLDNHNIFLAFCSFTLARIYSCTKPSGRLRTAVQAKTGHAIFQTFYYSFIVVKVTTPSCAECNKHACVKRYTLTALKHLLTFSGITNTFRQTHSKIQSKIYMKVRFVAKFSEQKPPKQPKEKQTNKSNKKLSK